MENKHTRSPQTKKHYPSILESILILILNVVLLSLLSWILLSIWFGIQVILTDSVSVKISIQGIVDNQQAIVIHYYSGFFNSVVHLTQHVQDMGAYACMQYIGCNITAILIGVFEISLTRFYVFIAFMPFMTAILFVLVIDGLVQRDKRKFQGARESTFLFHLLKPMARFSFFILFFLYMVIPLNVSPEVCNERKYGIVLIIF
jgi:hypothetical protein